MPGNSPSLFIAMTAAKEDVTYQNGSPLGSETVRANLRSALMDHLHSQAPYSFLGFHRWTAPSAKNQAAGSGKLLVGDPIVLAVSRAPISIRPGPLH